MEDVAEDFTYFTMAREFGLKPEEVDKMDSIMVETWLTILSEEGKKLRSN